MGVTIKNNTDEVRKAMSENIKKALVAIGEQAEGDAKIELENDPRRVDTGRLRGSITYATSTKRSKVEAPAENSDAVPETPKDDHYVYVGTNVEYASYVHYGTKNMEPNRFLQNAIQKNLETYRQIAEKFLKS